MSAQENTIDAFVQATNLGADGLASEAWVTADGQVVLHRDGRVGGRFRRKRFDSVDRSSLPDHVPSIEDLYDLITDSVDVLLDVGDSVGVEAIVDAARRAGAGAEQRLWLRHHDLDALVDWRRDTAAKLVLRSRLSPSDGPERVANNLRERGIDGLSLPHGDWSGGLITLLHRFDRYALATELTHEREMAKLLDVGVDGICSSHVDRMVAVAAQFT